MTNDSPKWAAFIWERKIFMQFFGGGHKFVTDADHIPGRNYLSGTAPVSVQGQNIVAQVIATYALTDKSLSNQVVTFNMTITSDTTSGRLYVGSSPNWQVYTCSDIQKGINKIQFTTKLNSDVDAIKITIDNSTANLVIQDVTLNKGNFAREYSPAPEDYVAKSDFDKKINIDNQVGSDPNNYLPASDNWSDIFGVNTGTSWTDRHNLLRVGQTQATDYFYGNNSSALFFGSGDTKGGLEVHYQNHEARIVGGNNPKILWSERIAWKSDLTTKTIIQDVDINTLTEEGNFFVESGNLDHFPAEYRNQWYFLNVANAIGTDRIKQTVTPDHSENGWVMTRTGIYHSDTHTVEWESWLISDFVKGKLLKSN